MKHRDTKGAEIGKQGISLSVLSVTSVVNESGIKRSSAESKTTKGHELARMDQEIFVSLCEHSWLKT